MYALAGSVYRDVCWQGVKVGLAASRIPFHRYCSLKTAALARNLAGQPATRRRSKLDVEIGTEEVCTSEILKAKG
jgi:hypothetical protein